MEDGNRMKVPIEKVTEVIGNPKKPGILENDQRSHVNGGYDNHSEVSLYKDKLLNGQSSNRIISSKAASLKSLVSKSDPFSSLPLGDKTSWQSDRTINSDAVKKFCIGSKANRQPVKENGSRESSVVSTGACGAGVRRVRKTRPHAQYLGLQPTVKFKCNQCSCTSFGSIGMLKEHQRSCSSKVARPQSRAPPAPLPNNNANIRISRKVYLCSACGTYYENWNLFLHIREVHDRHICLFCLGMFNRAQKLAAHLVIKHNVPENCFASKEELASKFSQTFYLICCKCDKVFTERDDFVIHECAQVAPPRSDTGRDSSRQKSQDAMKKVEPSSEAEPSHCHTAARDSVSLDCEENKDCKQTVASEETREIEPCVETAKASDTGLLNIPVCDNAANETSLLTNNVDRSDVDVVVQQTCISNASDPQVTNEQPSGMDVLADVISDTSGNLLNESFNCLEPSATLIAPSIKNSIGMSVDKINSDQSEMDSSMGSWKPPPRNRRPPKRYRVKDLDSHPVEPEVTPPRVMDVIKVPKLTVKLPKILPERMSSSESSSETDDSDKLTVDCDVSRGGVGLESDAPMESAAEEAPLEVPPTEAVALPLVPCTPEVPLAGEEVPVTELTLDRPLDKFPLEELLRTLMAATAYNCIYCNHARKIAVVGDQLALHFLSQHRFSATVDSITAEELMPETFVGKIKARLAEVHNVYLNMENYTSSDAQEMKLYDHTYECFQCYFTTTLHKDLYLHNRKMHQKTILLCVMCKSNFYSYSELLCHLCPGAYGQDAETEMHFRCCLCPVSALPSAFRLMVHLRKAHHACDVCLDTCHSQARLSNHVWKHKLHHLCYRCGIAYRNKPDITKHLFWKHGTESVLCNKCLQKKWPHVYHFCVPPNAFVCEECDCSFSRAARLKVHKRLHSGDAPHGCTWQDCTQRFISRRLLLKHEEEHNQPEPEPFAILDPPSITDTETKSDKHKIIDEIDLTVDRDESRTKTKKLKKNKRNKDKDNLLIDVNLPALNLSESDSSQESEAEGTKKSEPMAEVVNTEIEEPPLIMPEFKEPEPEPAPPVAGIWDNFKIYQAEIEKQNEKELPPVMKHVCDSDHDYCAIPTDELGYDKGFADATHFSSTMALEKSDTPKEKKKTRKKKANKKAVASSSSDSSSESDSSCSCKTNCSCSSSSDSSSSSSSSSSSLGSRRVSKRSRRDSADVDVVATEELPPLPPAIITSSAPPPIAETDLDTTETETDEDFYDEHPQRSANRLLAEKRNRLMLLATVAPVNNGSHPDSSRPASPEEPAPLPEKKVKTKKKRKDRRPANRIFSTPVQAPPPEVCPQPNRIKISLQSNTVVLRDVPDDDSESKRASKRRRVPNRFYGYSSDEEFMPKAQMPPKLEWRKEDLPSRPEVSVVAPVRLPSPPPLPVEASSSDEESSSSGALRISSPIPPQPMRAFPLRRQAREGESVYCYCKCPYDEVSEMIGCDAQGCAIEWFHFECVGIMVPPKGQWFCPDCRMKLEDSV